MNTEVYITGQDALDLIHVLSGLSMQDIAKSPYIQIWDRTIAINALTVLDLSDTYIRKLPESIGGLSNLQRLDLKGTQIQELPKSIGNLSSLQKLDLRGTQIQELPESIGNLKGLQYLYLSCTQIQKLPESIGNLGSLQSLYLSETRIQELPESIGNLGSLRRLALDGTQIKELRKSIGNLSSLRNLDLRGTQIQELPESIGNLSSLQNLDLRELHLSKIDKSLIDLNIAFFEVDDFFVFKDGINIYGLSIDTQPVSLFLQPRPLIEEYFASEMDAVNTVKCIILGYGKAGKSHTVLRLLNGGEEGDYTTSETSGVEICPYVVEKESKSFTINFWDFGGQEILYSVHRCFLTERSCYLIVVDNRQSDTDMMAQARYWLKNIASFASGAPVVIMANMWEKDEYRDDIEIKRLREEFGKSVDLKCVIPISAKTSSKQQFRQFMDKLIELAAGMVSCDMNFPVKWNQIRSELHKMGQGHEEYYISQAKYYSICCENGVDNRDIQDWLLDWFNDLGDCFSYYKPDANEPSSILEEYKVLDPRWITNAIYILIKRGYSFVDHQLSPGILTRAAIEKILEKAEGGVVDYIREYKDYDCSYIMRVMEKFELAYDVAKDRSKYFIPALLTKKEPEQKRPEEYKQLVKYVLEFDFLPSNILHKLMVRFFDELELSCCWDKGMVLRNVAIDQWVLLDMGGGDDRLEIEVFACGDYPACNMLNLMLYRLQKVNESLSLKPVHYIVTPDEYEEKIKVQHLLELKNGPRKSSIYQGEKKDYLIDELLGNMFGPAVGYAEKISAEGQYGGARIESYTGVLLEGIKKLEEDKDVSFIITRSPLMTKNIYVQDSIYNEHADQSSQTIHGDIHNNQDKLKDIEKLTDLLYDNLPVLTEAVQEIAKSDEKLAGDLRDINVQMTMARIKKEEATPAKQNMIQNLSTSADLMTVLQGMLAAATALNNPALTDTILRLIQNV